MRGFASILLVAGLACATTEVPIAQEIISWRAADARWSLHIVTVDPGGDERVTRIWLATVDGLGALRTGDSRWWQNLETNRECRIRVLGIDYPVSVGFVTEHEEKVRIDEAFLEKYGWVERVMFWQERGETHENYARLHAGEAR